VQIAFGPTRVRTLAAAASVLALAWLCIRASAPWRANHRSAVPPALRLALALGPTALFALACTHDTLRPGLAAPVVAGPDDRRLVSDLTDAAAGRQARIASPSGPELGPFVHPKRLAIAGRERRLLYMHPPASVEIALDLPDRPAFQAGIALDPGVWEAPEGDGVRFVVEVTPEGGPRRRVFEEHVNPRGDAGQRRWLDRWIDLSEYGNRRVTLTLRTEPQQNPFNDWAGWADPAIILQRDARRPGGGPTGPLPTPRAS
jgi:hypothetical protein